MRNNKDKRRMLVKKTAYADITTHIRVILETAQIVSNGFLWAELRESAIVFMRPATLHTVDL